MMSQPKTRFVGLDVHKHYVMVAAVNALKAVVLPPRKVGLVAFEAWAAKHLHPTDQVVLEATGNAWYLYDLLIEQVERVVVAHPPHVKLIAASMVKTDKRDVLTLARLLAVDMIPAVWVPPIEVRELRALISHRHRLISQQTQLKNRLRSVLHCHQLVLPDGKLFGPNNRGWWQALKLSPSEALRVRQDLLLLDHLAPLLQEVDDELRRLSVSALWVQYVPFLLQLSGIGLLTAMTILAAIGDISRFLSAKKLVGYAGLGASIHASGLVHRGGRITKQGRKELRRVLIEAAWIAVRYDPYWRQQFEQLEHRRGKHKAIVAIARKLLVVIWHVLSQGEVDRRADPDKVAFSLMQWAWKVKPEWCGGLSSRQFIRYHLLKLDLGHDLTHVVRGKVRRLIAPAEEVLTLCPELRPAD
jgi:transposase